MFRRLARLLSRKEYREGAYAHPDLSAQTGLAWHVRLRLLLTGRGGVDPTDDKPAVVARAKELGLTLLGFPAA